jgi:hypothetical protein
LGGESAIRLFPPNALKPALFRRQIGKLGSLGAAVSPQRVAVVQRKIRRNGT